MHERHDCQVEQGLEPHSGWAHSPGAKQQPDLKVLEAPGVPQITAAANSPGVLGNPPVVVGPEAWGAHLGWVGGLGTDPGPGPGVSGLGIIRCDFASTELTDKRLEEDGRASIRGRIRPAPLVLEGSGGFSETVGWQMTSMMP